MKRNLNLIATAASLILLGLPGESRAFQNYHDPIVGSGILSVNKSGEANVSPAVVKSERKLLSELKPLTMPKVKQLAIPKGAASNAAVKADTASQRSPVINNSRLPDAGMPIGARGSAGVPPIIRSSSRRLSQSGRLPFDAPVVQANSSAVVPPVIKTASRQLTYAGGQGFNAPPAQYNRPGMNPEAIPSIVTGAMAAPPTRTAAYRSQGSTTRSPLPRIESSVAPLPTPGPLPQDGNFGNGFGGSSTRSLPDAGSQSVLAQPSTSARSPEYFSAGPAIGEQPVFEDGGCATCAPVVSNDGACATCGTGMTDGVCPTCGPGAGYSNGPVIEDLGTFGLVSASRCYFHAEALVFTRADGDISGTSIAALNDFDSGGGLRLTFGRKEDSISGREIGIFALSGVEEDSTIQNSPFLLEDFQQQSKQSELYSIESNRVNFGWDIVKTFAGLKFIRFDDSYQFAAIDVDPSNNRSSSLDAVNNLFGAHLGGELFYDIGYRWSGSVKGSWGVYANLSDFDSTNSLATGSPFARESNQGTISTSAELNLLAHYQIQTNMRFQIGYNVIFIGNVATVSDNLAQQVPSLNGIDVSDSDDVLFHGLSLGLEFYR